MSVSYWDLTRIFDQRWISHLVLKDINEVSFLVNRLFYLIGLRCNDYCRCLVKLSHPVHLCDGLFIEYFAMYFLADIFFVILFGHLVDFFIICDKSLWWFVHVSFCSLIF